MQENKNVKIEDTPEYKALLENYDQLMDQMEADREQRDISTPEDWDRDFRRTIDKTLKAERRKKILRRVGKCGLAAAACLVVLVGTGAAVQTAEGDNMLQVFYHKLVTDEDIYDTYGTADYDMEAVDDGENIHILNGETLTEVFDSAEKIIKTPIFYIDELEEAYSINYANYDEVYHVLTIEVLMDKGSLYISETQVTKEIGEGVNVGDTEVTKVYNEYLKQYIPIYQGEQDGFYIVDLEYNHNIFLLQGCMSLDDCEMIAKSVKLK